MCLAQNSGLTGFDMLKVVLKIFPITYDIWKTVCEMYFDKNARVLKSYLQWFPFSILSESEKETIKGESYFEKYIQSGAFVHFSLSMLRTDNFMQKGDGSFRNSSLLSPILYLIVQSFGKYISEIYNDQRPNDISIYYSGNYAYSRCHYKEDYDQFYKEINEDLSKYQYFIKTDIREFFGNINLNRLIQRIDKIANENDTKITQNHLQLLKELLQYCGNGHFPIIENSTASSYLATIVFLDEIDTVLHAYITDKIDSFRNFKMIRYVDDLYILISPSNSKEELTKPYNEILSEYSSILKSYDLTMNMSKCCLKPAEEISVELLNSLYDEYVNGIKCEIAELCPNGIVSFINRLSDELHCNYISIEQYSLIVEEVFFVPNVEFTAHEVFNYFVFENANILRSPQSVKAIEKLIEQDVSFISLDPKRLTTLIIRSESDRAIKTMLNQLFVHHREEKWNSYDTTIAINYLTQTRFCHTDLLDVLKKECQYLYDYQCNFCKKSFALTLSDSHLNKLVETIGIDTKAYYLYFMHSMELNKFNIMSAFSYYKNYFDRLTAHLAFVTEYENNSKRPNYKLFYKENELVKFYKNIAGSEIIIKKAHDLRNANPLSHASAELIDHNGSSRELLDCIENLNSLILKSLMGIRA